MLPKSFILTDRGPQRIDTLTSAPFKLHPPTVSNSTPTAPDQPQIAKIEGVEMVQLETVEGFACVVAETMLIAVLAGDTIEFKEARAICRDDRILFSTNGLKDYRLNESGYKTIMEMDFSFILQPTLFMEKLTAVNSNDLRMILTWMLVVVAVVPQADDSHHLEASFDSWDLAFLVQTMLGFLGVLSEMETREEKFVLVMKGQFAKEYIRLCNADYMMMFLESEKKKELAKVMANKDAVGLQSLTVEMVSGVGEVQECYQLVCFEKTDVVFNGGLIGRFVPAEP